MVWTAFILGMAGSLHCVGMCGPIALSIPVKNRKKMFLNANRILYNLGRMITYTFLGLIFGIFGAGFSLAGKQQYLSIAMGVIILVILIGSRFEYKILNKIDPLAKLSSVLRRSFKYLYKRKSRHVSLLIGMVNGLLPCGLVYVALASSLLMPDIIDGMIFMALFGLGTFPVLFIFSLSNDLWPAKLKLNFNRIKPVLIASLAILFIVRGLNLGIPYVSPEITENNKKEIITICGDNQK